MLCSKIYFCVGGKEKVFFVFGECILVRKMIVGVLV